VWLVMGTLAGGFAVAERITSLAEDQLYQDQASW
jgi:hypothetical protein